MFFFPGASGKRRRKPSSPTGEGKADGEAAKSEVPPTPEVAESKPEGEEDGEGDGEEKEEEKAPRTVST